MRRSLTYVLVLILLRLMCITKFPVDESMVLRISLEDLSSILLKIG